MTQRRIAVTDAPSGPIQRAKARPEAIGRAIRRGAGFVVFPQRAAAAGFPWRDLENIAGAVDPPVRTR